MKSCLVSNSVKCARLIRYGVPASQVNVCTVHLTKAVVGMAYASFWARISLM